MNTGRNSSQTQTPTETGDPPRNGRTALDARDVLTRVLYETLSGRIADDLQWALG